MLSGLFRHAWNKSELVVENKSRGGAIADVASSKDEISVLFPSNCVIRPRSGVEDETSYLTPSYEDYAWYDCSTHLSQGVGNLKLEKAVPGWKIHLQMEDYNFRI